MISKIDHIVYTYPTLQEGMDHMEGIFGIRPLYGGKHQQWGTHNAILSIGESSYLEIVAPDHTQEKPTSGRWLENKFMLKPQISTWALRSFQIEKDYMFALKNGLTLGDITAGSRIKEDGTELRWKLTDPYISIDELVPFLIDWGKTSHPAINAPYVGRLVGLTFHHPFPKRILDYFNQIGIDFAVNKADHATITARIKTNSGKLIQLG